MSLYSDFSTHTAKIFYSYHRAPEYHRTSSRFYSSLQSHRSRVFARKEERFPSVVNHAGSSFNQINRIAASRYSEPLKHVQDVAAQRTVQQSKLYSAPQPAGKVTTNHLPVLQQNRGNDRPSPKQHRRNASKTQSYDRSEVSPSRVLGSHIAGMSSKEQVQVLHSEKMASGWAEMRAGHTIPQLRDSQDLENSPREHPKDHSPTGRSTVDHSSIYSKSISKSPIKSEVHAGKVKEGTVKKRLEDEDSIGSGDKPASKKPFIKKTARPNVKSKVSSGYGSMSSDSQHEDHAAHKYSIFRPAAHNPSAMGSEKTKEISSIYKNKVLVEDNSYSIGANVPEEEHILTEKEADMYNHIKSTYMQSAELERGKRKEKFFRKLQDVQIDAALQHNKELRAKAAKKEQAKNRQLEQLAHIRKKFDEERIKRYKSQYVTKNFLNYERMDRKEYGLPENFMKNTEYQAKLKRTGGPKVTATDFIKREIKLKKNYNKMFREPTSVQSAAAKEPKREGKEQVTLEIFDAEGNPKKGKKVDVKSELQEAEDMIRAISNNDENGLELSNDEDIRPETKKVIPGSKPSVIPTAEESRTLADSSKTTAIPANKTRTTPAGKTRTITTSTKTIPASNKVSSHKPTDSKSGKVNVQHNSKVSASTKNISFTESKKEQARTNKPVADTVEQPRKPELAKPAPARYESKVKESIAKLEQSSKQPAASANQPVFGSVGVLNSKLDTVSIDSRISVITEESETGVDFYEQLMAKYGIELSDDDDD